MIMHFSFDFFGYAAHFLVFFGPPIQMLYIKEIKLDGNTSNTDILLKSPLI